MKEYTLRGWHRKLGKSHKESPEKEFEVVWVCEAKGEALRSKDCGENRSSKEKEERKSARRWLDRVREFEPVASQAIAHNQTLIIATYKHTLVCKRRVLQV